jgi:hypothetical protein
MQGLPPARRRGLCRLRCGTRQSTPTPYEGLNCHAARRRQRPLSPAPRRPRVSPENEAVSATWLRQAAAAQPGLEYMRVIARANHGHPRQRSHSLTSLETRAAQPQHVTADLASLSPHTTPTCRSRNKRNASSYVQHVEKTWISPRERQRFPAHPL